MSMPHQCKCGICGQVMQWLSTQPNDAKCLTCGKRLFGFSIPRLGIHEVGDFCMCVTAEYSDTTGADDRG